MLLLALRTLKEMPADRLKSLYDSFSPLLRLLKPFVEANRSLLADEMVAGSMGTVLFLSSMLTPCACSESLESPFCNLRYILPVSCFLLLFMVLIVS